MSALFLQPPAPIPQDSTQGGSGSVTHSPKLCGRIQCEKTKGGKKQLSGANLESSLRREGIVPLTRPRPAPPPSASQDADQLLYSVSHLSSCPVILACFFLDPRYLVLSLKVKKLFICEENSGSGSPWSNLLHCIF